MILQSTITNLLDKASIADVIGAHVKLQDSGAGKMKGCCPFHNEKTPSFNVNLNNGFFKCFGCGKSGDVISFVRELEGLTFSDAVEKLAAMFNVDVEFDGIYSREDIQAFKERAAEQEQLLAYVEQRYHQRLLSEPKDSAAWNVIFSRGYTEQTVIDWRIGYAPNEWKFITDQVIERGWFQPALDLGLIKSKDANNYDVYRNRIIIPSRNTRGVLNGFIGRRIGDDEKFAKYINPVASDVYRKSSSLFGLSEAIPHINEATFCYLVEGNLDVVSLANVGIQNVVATGGTALTVEQCKLLHRYTRHVVLIPDADAPGLAAAEKQIDLLLAADFFVELIELPEGQDPDSWVRANKL